MNCLGALCHSALVRLGMVPLTLAWACLAAGIACMVAADKLQPNARWGNCWSFAAPRWWATRDRSYLTLRAVRGARLVGGYGIVPHVIYQADLGADARIEQPLPLHSYSGGNLIAGKLLFAFTVRTDDRDDSGAPPPAPATPPPQRNPHP